MGWSSVLLREWNPRCCPSRRHGGESRSTVAETFAISREVVPLQLLYGGDILVLFRESREVREAIKTCLSDAACGGGGRMRLWGSAGTESAECAKKLMRITIRHNVMTRDIWVMQSALVSISTSLCSVSYIYHTYAIPTLLRI